MTEKESQPKGTVVVDGRVISYDRSVFGVEESESGSESAESPRERSAREDPPPENLRPSTEPETVHDRPTDPGPPPDNALVTSMIPLGGPKVVEGLSKVQDIVTMLRDKLGSGHALYDPLGTFADVLTKFRRCMPHMRDSEIRDANNELDRAVRVLFSEYDKHLESVPTEMNQYFAQIFMAQSAINPK